LGRIEDRLNREFCPLSKHEQIEKVLIPMVKDVRGQLDLYRYDNDDMKQAIVSFDEVLS